MGTYAFLGKPGYQREAERLSSSRLVPDAGLQQRWKMAVAVWHASDGYGEETDIASLPNSCIALALSCAVECVKGGTPGRIGNNQSASIMVFRAGDPCLYVARGAFRFAHLNFTDELWRDGAAEASDRPVDSAELASDRVFTPDRETRALADAYLARALNRAAPSALEMDSRANLVALALINRHSSLSAQSAPRLAALAPHRLTRVKEYIEARRAGDVKLSEIAAAAELSPYHFLSGFKRETGVPPHRYLMERRVERAREMLATDEASLAEIALACGFANQSHFTTAFERHTGLTPGAWRHATRY